MSDLLKEITLRVLVSGVICTAAMIIAGEGAAKEPVRISCAALLIITLATPLTGDIKSLLRQTDFSGEIEHSIETELANANAAQYQLACDNLRTSMANRLKNAGVICDIMIDTEILGTDFCITDVYIIGEFDSVDEERVVNILGSEYGVSKDSVMFVKE